MRGKPASKRKRVPDYKYSSILIGRFINQIMRRGKKSVAEKVVYSAFDFIQEKTKKDPLLVFEEAMKNVAPSIEVRSRRIGGANYQIPVEVRGERKETLAFRWIISVARAKKGKPMSEKLGLELIDAAKKQGEAVKKKEDVHRMAEANRAFAHFA